MDADRLVSIELTVALCTCNPRPDLITRAVGAVIPQLQEFGGSAELLIIDNNSTPPLKDAGYLRGLPLGVIREPVQGLTAARAAAVRNARGRIVLFVDDDNVLTAGYLSGVVAAFTDPALGVLGGSIVPEYESPPPPWLSAFEDQLAIRRYPADLVVETTSLPYTSYFPVGAGCAVLRSVALAHVTDSETRGRIEGRKGDALSSGEDLDLDLFALSAGYKLRIVGSLSLTHVIPAQRTTEQYISRLVVSNVVSAAEVDRKWRASFGRPVFDFLSIGRVNVAIRRLYFRLLAPLSIRSRMKRMVWDEILRAQQRSA